MNAVSVMPVAVELGWSISVPVLVYAGLALVLFGQAFARLRARGRADHAPGWRLAVFSAGLLLLVLALVSPVSTVGERYLLAGHMLQHVVVADLAPALLVLAVSGPLLFFLLPAPVLRLLARAGPLRGGLRLLLVPWVAIALWAATIALWHVPSLYELALRSQLVHDLEHLTFFGAGLLVWYQLLDPARRHGLTRAGRLGFAVALFAAGQVLAMVLLFSFRPLYSAYAQEPERLLGLSPLADQRVAALVMMAEQTIVLGTLAAWLLLGMRGAGGEIRTYRRGRGRGVPGT